MDKFKELEIEKWDEAEYGVLTEANMEKKLKSQGFDHFKKYIFPPGMEFPDHTHGVTKKDCILRGSFEFRMFGQTVELEAGDMLDVPGGSLHSAKVLGSIPVTFYDASKLKA